ncbi:hypothetical protein PAPYR_1069 [Paratrimastix pyriformis]|uniref:Uncharacterized protein n=1 Tax=Paratrimastix pyriformis TaxID=342808 RepID=A0ABQ8UTG5_9EUKA|nr:hypothetical protein PAPYR_1069 [Paratrimastix pyriformis]
MNADASTLLYHFKENGLQDIISLEEKLKAIHDYCKQTYVLQPNKDSLNTCQSYVGNALQSLSQHTLALAQQLCGVVRAEAATMEKVENQVHALHNHARPAGAAAAAAHLGLLARAPGRPGAAPVPPGAAMPATPLDAPPPIRLSSPSSSVWLAPSPRTPYAPPTGALDRVGLPVSPALLFAGTRSLSAAPAPAPAPVPSSSPPPSSRPPPAVGPRAGHAAPAHAGHALPAPAAPPPLLGPQAPWAPAAPPLTGPASAGPAPPRP